jgi:hypothetical protein
MAFVTFLIFQVFNLLNVRNDIGSVFSRETLENRAAFAATGAVIVLLVLLVEMDIAHSFFSPPPTSRPGSDSPVPPLAQRCCGWASSSRSCCELGHVAPLRRERWHENVGWPLRAGRSNRCYRFGRCDAGLTMVTGQVACSTQCMPTDPRRALAKPPRPRCPTTSRSAPCACR